MQFCKNTTLLIAWYANTLIKTITYQVFAEKRLQIKKI